MSKRDTFTVAAVQAAPVFLDRDKSVAKARDLIAKAAKKGARLIVFPEAFIPTYPDWVWVVPPGRADLHRDLYGQLLDQAVAVPSDATDALCRAAKAAKVYVVIGINERNVEASGSSIYNTIIYIDDKGAIMGKHRKLMPTSAERLVWAAGDGSTLDAFDTPFGKLGGLICWENYMPLARYAMYAWGTQIYVAPTWDSSDNWLATLRHIAREGRCYVIGCCIAMRTKDFPSRYEFKKLYPEGHEWINVGNSTIVSPDGYFIAGPLEKKEDILYAEIDPSTLRDSKFWFDAAGHYARPDVFQLTVNRDPNQMLADTIAEHGSPESQTRRRTSGKPAARSRRR